MDILYRGRHPPHFVNPIAIDGIWWEYYIVYIALLVAWLVIAFFWYPETRGLLLEDILMVLGRT